MRPSRLAAALIGLTLATLIPVTAPSGLFPLASGSTDLVGMGLLNQDLADRFVEGITTAGRDGRFWMSVTMTTVVARRPG